MKIQHPNQTADEMLRTCPCKRREPTPFILFLAMTVTKNTSDRPNVSLVHI